MRKILRIRKGEYLALVNVDSIVTTYYKKDAINLHELSWETIASVFSNLHNQGFKNLEVIEVSK